MPPTYPTGITSHPNHPPQTAKGPFCEYQHVFLHKRGVPTTRVSAFGSFHGMDSTVVNKIFS